MRAGLALAFAVLSAAPAGAVTATGPKVTAKAAIIVDAASGEIIWSRNPDLRLHPASTTKVMTAIVAVESEELARRVPVSTYAASTAPSKLWLKPGQSMVVRDLLYAVLLKSANDAAVVVAEGVGGSVPAFSRQMNAKARAIGATRSSFSNPHGLTQEGHLSTAADLARIFRYAMSQPLLREVLTTKSIRVPVYAKGVHTVAVHSHNRLLTGYEHQVIGKTGYTRAAKRCFVGAARGDDGREVIVAMMGSNSLWPDAKALVEYGLDHMDDQKPELQMARVQAAGARVEDAARAKLAEPVVRDRPAPAEKPRYPEAAAKSPEPARPVAAPEPPPVAAPVRFTAPPPKPRFVAPEPEPKPETPPAAVARVETATTKPAPIELGDEPSADPDVPMGDAPDPMPVVKAPAAKPPIRMAMLNETPTQAANSAGASRWAVELGPFETKTRAETTRRGLADLGYGAKVSGNTIRLGAFSSRSRADRLADRLRLSGYRPTIVALR